MNYIKPAFLLILILAISTAIYAQIDHRSISKMHNEAPDEKSVPMPLEEVKTSPGYVFEASGIFTIQANVDEDGDNILGDAANEPSIAVDPTDPNRIMIGWRQFDNVSSNFRQAGYAYSTDAGQSWTFPGSIDAGVFRSDPVLDCNNDGIFFYNSLTINGSGDYLCTVYKTGAGNVEWDEGTFAQGGDKQWMRIDNTGGTGSGNIYSNWTMSYSYCWPEYFTRSTDDGNVYETCTTIPGEPFWGTENIGPDGELYVVGRGDFAHIMLAKSTNAQVPGSAIVWEHFTAVDLDGQLSIQPEVNPVGLMGQVWVDCDRSDGSGRGNVYICASVDRYGSVDPGDVMFARSTDGGLNFEDPIRINNDISVYNHQWFATMSVAPNGRIDVIWLDTRADPAGLFKSVLYYSFSVDQGVTWSENEQMSAIFDPHLGWPQQQKMGDYFDMVSDDGGAHLAWANTLNGEQDVYYSYITPDDVGIDDIARESSFARVSNFPNPFTDKTSIRYTLGADGHVRLSVYDIYGNEVAQLLNEQKSAGTFTVDFVAPGLSAGVYFAVLTVGDSSDRIRIVKVARY
ncbi:MAG: hypothetical protein DRJ15_09390 [Bacteroidetes bacterium]|nr:MAG: hypothetical protein DRJ15_09390 [Bacteroidota bacterium]